MITTEIAHDIFYRAYAFFGVYESELSICCAILFVLYAIFIMWALIHQELRS